MNSKSRDEIAEAYRSAPWWYDVRGFFILTFAYNSTLTHQLRFFSPHFGPRHLEVACGTGTLLELVLRWRKLKGLPEVHVTALDYADSMLAGARHRFRRWTNVDLRHADAAAMPFDDATFDTVNIANSIHCLPDVNGALKEIFRVLKPGGTLATNALLYPRGVWPFKQIAQRIDDWGIRKGILYSPFHAEDIRRRVAAAGFKINSERISGNCYDLVSGKPQG